MRLFVSYTICLFLSLSSEAQDSLKLETGSPRPVFEQSVDHLRSTISPNVSIDTALISKAAEWSKKNGNQLDSLRIEIINAQYAAATGNKREALKVLNQLLADSAANDEIVFNTQVMLRDLYFSLDAYDKAVQLHKQIDWSVAPDFYQSSAHESFLAFVYAKIGDNARAAEILRNSIGKMRNNGFHYWEMSYTNSLGVIYEKMGLTDSAWVRYKQATYLLEKHFKKSPEMGEQQYQYIYGLFTGNKAQILASQGQHLQAIPLYKVDINTSLSDTSLNELRENGITSLLWLTKSYLAIDQPESAASCLERAKSLIKATDPSALRELLLQRTADYFHHIGMADSAYLTLRALMQFRDSLQSEQTVMRTQDLIIAYESILQQENPTEKEEIEALRKKTQRQQETNILFILITILTIVVAAAAIFRFQSKNKQQQSIVEKNKEIQNQKNLMEASLKEKETLLREVNHRVKNNLQIISSLLFFQSKKLPDQHSKAIMQEAQQRIQTMSLIHQQLYQQQNFEHIDIKNHLQDLTRQIISSYALDDKNIQAHLDVRAMQIPVDKAVPLSLIVNELVTNSLKHAFQNTKKGNIYLILRVESDNGMLEYSDDGSGLAIDYEAENTDTIGMKLIKLLTQQLNGIFTIASRKPFRIELSFELK